MRIGELAERVGIKPSAIRFYEASGLLPASGRGLNGYRDYDEGALKRLQMIQLAQRLGFSLEALRGMFEAAQEGPAKETILAQLQQRRAEIQQLRAQLDEQEAELTRLMAECKDQWGRGECVDLSRQPLARVAGARRRK